MIYDRMTHEHGYSVRELAQKLGKDKGYIENRLRLAGAPTEIKQLVSLRKDTLSHAYELLKVEDPEEAPPAGRAGRQRRAEPGQAAREDRGSTASPLRPRSRQGADDGRSSETEDEMLSASPRAASGGRSGRRRTRRGKAKPRRGARAAGPIFSAPRRHA